jgi:MoaA/NifB/PqqE/SkfB family radical SAM enzyme
MVWQNRHMSMGTFMKLAPAFRRTGHIHLQGWGEPFMHPRFFEMAAVAKTAGCHVGTTTNGVLFNQEIISKVVEGGIDLVAFSLAGTGEENDRIRKGTRMEQVLNAIRALSMEKEKRHVQTPAIHVAYMLFKSGLGSLTELPSLLEGLGVSNIIISTLDFVSSEELLPEVIHPETAAEYDELISLLDAVVAKGEEKSMGIHYHLPHPELKRTICTENVGRAVCVSSDGAIGPCVYAGLDLADSFHLSGGERNHFQRMTFGNVNERPLEKVWRDPRYKAFRRSFSKKSLAVQCQRCPKRC